MQRNPGSVEKLGRISINPSHPQMIHAPDGDRLQDLGGSLS